MGRKQKRNPRSPKSSTSPLIDEWKPAPGYVYDLHNDKRETLVEIDKKLYKLVFTGLTLKEALKLPFEKCPHVRHLNHIKYRSAEEQAEKNAEQKTLHDLADRCSVSNTKVTSLKKAIALGTDVPKEVEKLVKEKEEALKKGDSKRAGEIRKQLRKLNYKRYLQGGDK